MRNYILCYIFVSCSVFAQSSANSPDLDVFPHQSDVQTVNLHEPDLSMSSPHASRHLLSGIASWYGTKFQGRLTASGEKFDTNKLTAAHKTLPFNTIVNVTNLNTNNTVEVRINDRGPFVENRVIDLSRKAATALDMLQSGTAPVRIDIITLAEESPLRTIQISAFSEQGNAAALQRELKNKGIATSIEQSGPIHRVIISKVHSDDIAALQKKLSLAGYEQILIRRK